MYKAYYTIATLLPENITTAYMLGNEILHASCK
jgi:hypothetical protein